MRKVFLLVGASLTALSGAAQAQSNVDSGSPDSPATTTATETAAAQVGGGEIIVTARRRAEDASRVPISITAFSGEQLDQKGVNNVADLVKITPGLNITGGGSKLNPFITIRGFTRGVTGNVQAGVITYMNDVPLMTQGSLLPTFDLDNIQVLKGPQGTLFGRNAIGGAILSYTKAPTQDFGGYVEAEIGSFNFQQIEGAVNVPIVKDVLALRVAGQINSGGSFIDALPVAPYSFDPTTRLVTPGNLQSSGRDFDDYDTRAVRASLLFEPTPWFKNVTVADYTQIRGANNSQNSAFFPGGAGGAAPAVYLLPPAVIRAALPAPISENLIRLAQCGTSPTCDFRLAQAAVDQNFGVQYSNVDPDQTIATVQGISNTTEFEIGADHVLKNIFAYRTVSTYNTTDIDGTALPVITAGTIVGLKQLTDELQLSGSFGNLDYTVGGFYYKESPRYGGSQGLEVNAFFGLSHTIGLTYITNESKALYGQIDYSFDNLVEGLSVTAGVRQTWDSVYGCSSNSTFSPFAPMLVTSSGDDPNWVSEAECNAGVTAATIPGSTGGSSSVLPKAKFDKLTYTLGANWQISPAAMVYVTHRRGYRAGNYNTPAFDPYVAGVQTFEPETLTDFEIGTKVRWDAGSVSGTLDLALFQGKNKGNQFGIGSSGLGGGVCVPEAIGSAGRAANCATSVTQQAVYPVGTPGVTIAHPAQTTIGNVGNLTMRGFEIAATISPTTWLTVGGGASYFEYDVDSLTFDQNFLNLLRAGNQLVPTTVPLAQQPKWTANGNVSILYPEPVLGGDLMANLDIRYSDTYLLGQSTVQSYATADFRITLAGIGQTGVDIAAYVKNIWNEDYAFGTAGSAPFSTGVESFIYAPPRTVGLVLKYNFGS